MENSETKKINQPYSVHYLRGVEFFEQGKFNEAVLEFKECTELQPKDAGAWYNWGTILAQLGHVEEAVPKFTLAAQLDPNDERIDLALAQAYLKLPVPRYDQALQLAEKAVSRTRELRLKEIGSIDIAKALSKLDRKNDAVDMLNKLIANTKEEDVKLVALLNLGVLFEELGNNEEALKNFYLAINSDPKYSPALNNIGSILARSRQFEDALKYFLAARDSAKTSKEEWNAVENTAETYSELSRHIEAVEILSQYIKKNANSAMAFLRRGDNFTKLKRFSEAEADYRQALKNDPSLTIANINLGGALAAQGQVQEATAILEGESSINPPTAAVLNNLGIVYQNKKEIAKAAISFKKALELDSTDCLILTNLASLLYDQNDYFAIIELGEKMEREGGTCTNVYAIWGKTLSDLYRLDEAEEYLEKALSSEPTNFLAMLFMADIARQRGQNELAIDWYERAKAVDNESAASYLGIGSLFAEVGEFESAALEYSKILERDESRYLALNGLSYLYWLSGDFNASAQFALRAIAEFEEGEDTNQLGAIYYLLWGLLLHSDIRDLAESERVFLRGLERFPNDPALLIALGDLHVSLDKI